MRLWIDGQDVTALEATPGCRWPRRPAGGEGYSADAITDDDLHAENPELLAPFTVVITRFHRERWPDAVEAYPR